MRDKQSKEKEHQEEKRNLSASNNLEQYLEYLNKVVKTKDNLELFTLLKGLVWMVHILIHNL